MIAILADDLTSALDGAAPFASRGLAVRVTLKVGGLAEDAADVRAADLDSRFARPAEAKRRFAAAARAVSGAAVLLKTVDSTLRGNLGPEVCGALAGSGRARAIVAPAFPAAGRITVDGRQFVDGVPVEQTAFARDLRNPVVTGRVADRLAGVGRSLVSVHDAASDADLDALVARVGLAADVLWVGSPGLAAALARACTAPDPGHRPMEPRPAGRVLVVVGSQHPANVAQVEALVGAGAALIRMDGEDMARTAPLARQVEAAFLASPVVGLVAPQVRLPDGSAGAARLARSVAALVARCASSFDGLVATGGDTARRMADALGTNVLDVAGEVEPGVPWGILRGPGRDLSFAAKAGGFGRADTLLRCVQRLRTPQETSP